VWKTILVGGLNAGGRGYYALDITDPTAPQLLWEFTTTAGNGSTKDDDLGYSYGNPVITAKADGTWVVLLTSGYNNTSPGDGQGYLYVLNAGTGAIISKIGTGVGSTTTPSGLAKISAWNDAPSSNRATYVYGGDLLGNVWRFDINSSASATIGTGAVLDFATLDDPSGNPQPITTSPVLGKISGYRVIFIGTGKYLGTPDLSDTQVQSEYAIKDDNATATLVNPGGSPRNSLKLVQQTITSGNGVRSVSSNPVDFTTGRGWYVDFPDSGERVNIDGRLVQGTLLVATIVPSNTVCAPGGYGWLNFFNYQTGSSVDTSGVVSVSYNNTIVGINVLYINGVPVVETVTSNDPTPTVNSNVLIKGTASGFTGKRVLWRELNP
jgi:type IV pilus assembly protein PilY1